MPAVRAWVILNEMRVVHLSFSDAIGGAARGSLALHRALLEQGTDSWMLVEEKTVSDERVLGEETSLARSLRVWRRRLDYHPLRLYRARTANMFSPCLAPNSIVSRVRSLNPDIVHLHWVAGSFVLPELVSRFGVPVVWTMRDMWPFTGGCHTANDCDRYKECCGSCPTLRSSRERDLSRLVWMRKYRSFRGVDIHPVGISSWIADAARSSSLFRDRNVRMIPNAIDTDFWRGQDRQLARRALGLPHERHVVLFVAWRLDAPEKGYDRFVAACRQLATRRNDIHAVVVGSTEAGIPRDLGLPATFTGLVEDDQTLRMAYSAADVTVVPSSMEAFGKVAAESLSCGTPAVVFDRTGLIDIVDDRVSGRVVSQGDIDELTAGIEWVLETPARWAALGQAGRASVAARFSVEEQAHAYSDLYASLNSGEHDDRSRESR